MPKARPLSPHLQVYNMFKITSLTSILHRITGSALTLGLFVIVAWVWSLVCGPQAYATFNHMIQAWYGQVILFGFTAAFWYHFVSGMRHLLWDAGVGLKIETARKTGVVVLMLAAALTAVTWLYLWGV